MKAYLFSALTVLAAAAHAQAPAPGALPTPGSPIPSNPAGQPVRPMQSPSQPGMPAPVASRPAGAVPGQLPPGSQGQLAPRPAASTPGQPQPAMQGQMPQRPVSAGAPVGQAQGAPNQAGTPPGRFVPRNPLRPTTRPTVVPGNNPAMGAIPPGVPYQNRAAGMNGFPPSGQPIPGIPMPGEVVEEDPVKATGKRIGKLNGHDIFKLEDAYFFDKPTPKKKQK
jgi:hypothetical protein